MEEENHFELSESDYNSIVSLMKSCPFCATNDGDVYITHFHHWVCACSNCDSQGPVTTNPFDALHSWNKRND